MKPTEKQFVLERSRGNDDGNLGERKGTSWWDQASLNELSSTPNEIQFVSFVFRQTWPIDREFIPTSSEGNEIRRELFVLHAN